MRALFIVQLCEAKGILDSAGYHEIYKPMLASGLFSEHKLLSYGDDLNQLHTILSRRLQSLHEQLGTQPVVVYSAGTHTEKYLSELQQLNIVALADREPTLWGQTHCGYPVVSPDAMAEMGLPVVVSSRAWEESIIDELNTRYASIPAVYGLYRIGELRREGRRRQLAEIAATVQELQPQLLVYMPNHPDLGYSEQEIAELRRLGEFKLITVWWDYDEESTNNSYLDFERASLRFSDLILDAGNITKTERLKRRLPPYQDHEYVEKVVLGPSLINPELFYPDPQESLRYDIAIFGGAFGRRKQWIDLLRTRYGERFHHIGGAYQERELLPMAEYARKLRQTRIAVNTQTYPLRSQLKGKVREAMASGTFLLEEDNPETRAFVPDELGLAYFSSEQQLYHQIDYYLGHEQERAEVAQRVSRWYHETYQCRSWLQRILGHIM